MKPPWLVVSATYNQVLESRLKNEHQSYVLVAHILRSSISKDRGKILVVDNGDGARPKGKICRADNLSLEDKDLKGKDRIIYKVLGSPFLHDPAQSGLAPGTVVDTVVVTETDHMAFLGSLDNQHTKVPEAFSLLFQNRSLLFLGYNLDVWHYRLVGQIFSQRGLVGTQKDPYMVRQPTSLIEQRFWGRLHAQMILSDSETFAQTLCNTGGIL
jgi:hypothetical protein